MSYHKRLRLAAVLSLLLHALILLPWFTSRPQFGPAPEADNAPLIVNLTPPAQDPKRLIDVAEEGDPPEAPTDLIAEANSRARDEAAAQSPELPPGPVVAADDFESLAQAPAPAVETPPTPPAPEAEAPRKAEDRPQAAPLETAEEDLLAPLRKAPEAEEVERRQLAQAAPASQEAPAPRRTAGRKRGGAVLKGFTSFEAMQHELAPYLKQVRNKVEQRWNAAILSRYSGSSPRTVEVDCEIGADGKLVKVKAVGAPKDRVYAALCEDAIRRAGPFDPFPFTVPDIYRNKNLEIRWSFSFLK